MSAESAILACVLVSGQDPLRMISLGGDAAAPGGVSTEALAELFERAAAALRGAERDGGAVRTDVALNPAAPARARLDERIRIGPLEIHPETRLVLRGQEPVPLSRIEFDLLLALVRRDGVAATRLELVREVWGYGAAVTSRSVDTQIYNLRHKLEENPSNPRHLLTVSGVGYRLAR